MSKAELSKRAEAVLSIVIPAEAGIQNQSADVLDASLRWHDKMGRDPGLRQGDNEVTIRQQTLADLLGCSRRSIYRALKELKEAGKLVDLKKRAKNRCKVYRVCQKVHTVIPAQAPELSCQRRLASSSMPRPTLDASLRWHDKSKVTPQAREQWQRYSTNIKIVFGNEKDLEKHYAYVTSYFEHVTDSMELWHKTYAGLFVVYNYPPANSKYKGMSLEEIAYSTV